MEYEDPKCPWCRVLLLSDGSCPSSTHPIVCPFCKTRTERMICSREQCIKNQPRSKNHSTFPPRVQMPFEDVQRGDMRELKTAQALRAVLRIEHPNDVDASGVNGDEEDTNPQIQIVKLVERLLQTPEERGAFIESCDQERKISGVFIRDRDVDGAEMKTLISRK